MNPKTAQTLVAALGAFAWLAGLIAFVVVALGA